MPAKPPPAWQVNLAKHQQRFLGDGFNHEITLPALPFRNLRTEVPCPCGMVMIITGDLMRQNRECDVLICPTCESWHVIMWTLPEEPKPAIKNN